MTQPETWKPKRLKALEADLSGFSMGGFHAINTQSKIEGYRMALADLAPLLSAYEALRDKVDGVSNGYCRLCRGHRLNDLKGRPSLRCETTDCISNQITDALVALGQGK